MKLLKPIGKGLGVLVVLLLLVELVMRLLVPSAQYVQAGKLQLYANMQQEVSIANATHELPAKMRYSTNAQGFRGSRDLPPDSVFPIYCIGGSSTYCPYLGDDAAWPEVLHRRLAMSFGNIEVVNAGFEGLLASA